MYSPTLSGAVTLPALAQMKQRGEKIVALTAYDSTLAHLCDAAGVDVVLVGDSLGMVVQGHPTTLPVTVDQMVYHCTAVSRGLERAWMVADLPFGSYPDPARAVATAARLVAEGGAAMVKLEGAGHVLDSIAYLAARDVPVCAHLGLTAQSV
jgi:3-methyl-2-oxobutanoate hydroxymethyltransferase